MNMKWINRRNFLQAGAIGALGWPALRMPAAAQEIRRRTSRVPDLVTLALTQPNIGFPSVTPMFAAVFATGKAPMQMIRTESWEDLVAQARQMASSYRLSSFTSIQNMNRTWYYAAFQQGSGDYIMIRTPDTNVFQQTFMSLQGSYALVDFNVSWEAGRVYYSGYWLAGTKTQMLVMDLQDFDALSAEWTELSTSTQNPMRMTRVQAYTELASARFCALFEAGTGSYVLRDDPASAFAADVSSHTANTLIGLGYDPVAGRLLGCWRDLAPAAQFVINQDWNTLVATAQTAASTGLVLQALAVYPDAPSFDDYFEANLAPYVMGYAYAVAKDGQIVANGGGYARGPQETQNPNLPYTADSRMTLASVSKAITGVALEVLALQKNISFDAPFLPFLDGNVSNSNPVVATITLRQLANMQSGLFQEKDEGPPDLPSGETIFTEINNYLAMPIAGPPGQTYYYDNTNYSILQAVIDQVSGIDYAAYVTQNVLTPAGLNPAIINPVPDPASTGTLAYYNAADASAGYQHPQISLVGVSGWISSARELVKLMIALRGTSVLPQANVTEMFNDSIGWNLGSSGPSPYTGAFGAYYWKTGGLTETTGSGQSILSTCLCRLAEGYDLALLTNSKTPIAINTLCFNAFDARGVSAANLPPNSLAVQTIVNAASYLPTAAPGAYLAIVGSGFSTQPGMDWSAAIGSSRVLPQELNGVRVRVGSVDVYVEYVSSGQVNILLPRSIPAGIANVEVTTPAGGFTTSVTVAPTAPGLFTYLIGAKNYAAAEFGSTASLTYVAPVGSIPGAVCKPAKAGDPVALFGTGMGPTNPPWPDGAVLQQAFPAQDMTTFKVTVGGISAAVLYAGMIEAGLFQVNITIPAGLAAGDQLVTVIVSGVASQPNVFLSLG